MAKLYMVPEDVAPILGMSPAKIRKYMRDGTCDLGMVLPPEKTGKTQNEYRIYPAKLCKITGYTPKELMELIGN